MANSWLRLWHDMPTDPKWRTIARKSKQRIGDVIAVYLHLLVNASSNTETNGNARVTQGNADKRGVTKNLCADDIASSLDMDVEQVEQILSAMQGKVLDGERLTGWTKRQPKREDDSAPRVKAFRDKKRAAQEAAKNEKNDGETHGNAGVTQGNAPDKDPDKDKELKDKHLLSGAEKNQLQTGDPVFITLPLNDETEFPVTESMLVEYEGLYPSVDVRQELRNQRGWLLSEPSKRKTKRGIKKFITGWLSREQDRGPKPGAGGTHAQSKPTASNGGESRAMQKFHEAARARFGEDFMEILEGDAGPVRGPVDSEERGGTVVDLGRDDWESV